MIRQIEVRLCCGQNNGELIGYNCAILREDVSYQEFLQRQILENSVQDMLIALGIFIGIFIILRFCVRFLMRKLQKAAEKTKTHVDDAAIAMLGGIGMAVYGIIAIFVAAQYLDLPAIVTTVLKAAFAIVIVYEVIRVLHAFLLFLIKDYWLKDGEAAEHMSSILGLFIKIALWSVGFLLILSNLGVEVTSLVASMGIGGIAIALAVQNVLSDMFSSFSIYFDKPFKVGDFIIVGEHMGVVKQIGLKTTRIQALQGEEIVISNNELTSTRVRNFKKMQKRRIAFHFGVTYDTPSEKLKKIPQIVKRIMDALENAEFNRAHFKAFGDFSLNFEAVYYVLTGDYNAYMDIQQAINVALVEEFEKEKIDFAFPTRTIHLVKES